MLLRHRLLLRSRQGLECRRRKTRSIENLSLRNARIRPHHVVVPVEAVELLLQVVHRRVALQAAVVLLLLALLHEEVQLLLLEAVAVVDQPIRMARPCIAITK